MDIGQVKKYDNYDDDDDDDSGDDDDDLIMVTVIQKDILRLSLTSYLSGHITGPF